MNQDQVKAELVRLDRGASDCAVVFSGKKSKKVDGLYKPDIKEILIHNKNHEDDNAILYTAIHELAHHLQFARPDRPTSPRVHNGIFREIFHGLLDRAEDMGMYHSIFSSDGRFVELTKKIKGHVLSQNGHLMKEFGGLLLQAYKLCSECRIHFEDYIDRCLGIQRGTARQVMKVCEMNIDPAIGYDNMKIVASIKDAPLREEAAQALLEGIRPETVKSKYTGGAGSALKGETLDSLMEEKTRTEQAIERLVDKLDRLQKKIREIEARS